MLDREFEKKGCRPGCVLMRGCLAICRVQPDDVLLAPCGAMIGRGRSEAVFWRAVAPFDGSDREGRPATMAEGLQLNRLVDPDEGEWEATFVQGKVRIMLLPKGGGERCAASTP